MPKAPPGTGLRSSPELRPVKGGKTKQGYQRMVGWCRLMVMADGDG